MLKIATCLLVAMVASSSAGPKPDCRGMMKSIPQNAEILILETENGGLSAVSRNAVQPEELKVAPPAPEEPAYVMKKCNRNELFSPCKSECQRFCDLKTGTIRFPLDCTGKCVSGCACKKGYVKPPMDAPFKECISWATCTGLIEAATDVREH